MGHRPGHSPISDADRNGVCDAFHELCVRVVKQNEVIGIAKLHQIAGSHKVVLWKKTPADYCPRLKRAIQAHAGNQPELTCSKQCMKGSRCHRDTLLEMMRHITPRFGAAAFNDEPTAPTIGSYGESARAGMLPPARKPPAPFPPAAVVSAPPYVCPKAKPKVAPEGVHAYTAELLTLACEAATQHKATPRRPRLEPGNPRVGDFALGASGWFALPTTGEPSESSAIVGTIPAARTMGVPFPPTAFPRQHTSPTPIYREPDGTLALEPWGPHQRVHDMRFGECGGCGGAACPSLSLSTSCLCTRCERERRPREALRDETLEVGSPENDGWQILHEAPPEAPRVITVQIMSGEEVQVTNLAEDARAAHVCAALLESRPLPSPSTQTYELVNGEGLLGEDAPLDDDIALTAVVLEDDGSRDPVPFPHPLIQAFADLAIHEGLDPNNLDLIRGT